MVDCSGPPFGPYTVQTPRSPDIDYMVKLAMSNMLENENETNNTIQHCPVFVNSRQILKNDSWHLNIQQWSIGIGIDRPKMYTFRTFKHKNKEIDGWKARL